MYVYIVMYIVMNLDSSENDYRMPIFYPCSDTNSESNDQEGDVEHSDYVPDSDNGSSEDEQQIGIDEEEQARCGNKRRQSSTGGPSSSKRGQATARGRTRLRAQASSRPFKSKGACR
jgi:hypothetical protein